MMDSQKAKEDVLRQLIDTGCRITFAESCTGGLLAASLVALPSASLVLNESYVTYANQSKTDLCGVCPKTLEAYGAVSLQTAKEMAEGAAERAKADVAVAVSGIAGPDGGTDTKPVGTVCFGFYIKGKETVTEVVRFGDLGRNNVRQAAVDYAWKRLAELISCR